MLPKRSDNQRWLAATRITYRHGLRNAALAEIAKAAKVPLGNVYYYFKTKNEIGNAIIDLRVWRLRAAAATAGQTGFSPRAAVRFCPDKDRQPPGACRLGNEVLPAH